VLPAVPSESLPQVTQAPDARASQLQERAFWMSRDIAQAGAQAENCAKLAEAVSLIDANNAGP